MKKVILLSFLLSTILVQGQPKLVGTLSYHGPQVGGSIFRVDMPGLTPGPIHVYSNLSPHMSRGGVTAGDADWLYGMLNYTGTDNSGALYKIRKDGTGFTVVHKLNNFGGAFLIPYYHTDGNIYFNDFLSFKKLDPTTGIITDLPLNNGVYLKNLLIDADDWIYFTTSNNLIVKMKTDGSQWTELHGFNPPVEGGSGFAGLTEVPGDTLFGVQPYEGANNGGTIYSIKKDGTGFTVHHTFESTTGIQPESRLVYFDGKLYGTTAQGGSLNNGVLYTINPDGTGYRVLHTFAPGLIGFAPPFGSISISSNGRIFGSISQHYFDGFNSYRLFKVDTSGDNLQYFFNVNQRENGQYNQDILLQDNDETIFLTTADMGRHAGGVLNRVDTSGFSATGLFHFGTELNGFRPQSAPIKASDGKLYGTTTIGGTDGNGTLYSMNIDGTGYTKLHEFTDAEGYDPKGKLLEASDGKLYGVLQIGGSLNAGGIYRVDKTGSNFQIIYNFSDLSKGYAPSGGLVEDNTGALYGVTQNTLPGYGTIFKVNKDGSNYTVLKTFTDFADLIYPFDGLQLQGDYLYGVLNTSGTLSRGGVFRIKKDGTDYSTLHAFNSSTDGANPATSPIIASNGKLYGTTPNGGTQFAGVLYSMNTDGSNYTIVREFSTTSDGQYPNGGVIQASDGLLYGTTFLSNVVPGNNSGIIYKINLDGTGYVVMREFNTDLDGQGVSGLIDLQGSFTLPVEWLAFDAEKRTQSVVLTWKTAMEQNSDRFEVQRSANGVAFSTIGKVAAAGNTPVATSYSFTDNYPLNGTNYYRLKQVDADETYDYSKIVSVNFIFSGSITISPNPVPNQLNLLLPAGNRYSLIRILDASGKLIMQKNIAPASTRVSLDVQRLAKGWYVLQLNGETTERKMFIKE